MKVLKAAEAASMAVEASAGVWSGSVAMTSPVEGSLTVKVSPLEEEGRKVLLMKG